MSAGIVPVVERRGGVTVQVIDGDNGLLCDTNARFRDACAALYPDPALRRKMSATARAFVQQRFGRAQLRRDLVELLDLPVAA